MHKKLQTPVLTTVDAQQLESFLAFMNVLRNEGTVVAKLEAERLKPYLRALSKQTKADIAKASAKVKKRLQPLSNPRALQGLFEAVTQRTGNTILSEIVIAPEHLITHPKVHEGTTDFAGKSQYDGHSFILGFIQALDKSESKSVSIPVLGFDRTMMYSIEDYQPQNLLKKFQTVMTAGNHDMQHHYTNTVLNSRISIASKEEQGNPPDAYTAKKWFADTFDYILDTQPESYESWLMLNHARVRRLMEKGPEGKKLWQDCDRFFDELSRIGKEMIAARCSRESAHEVVDYFGSLLCFALMRFMPLDHPLFEHAIRRLEKADPDPGAIVKRADEMSRHNNSMTHYMDKVIKNYAAKGVKIIPEFTTEQTYFTVKRLQMIVTAPWIAHLFSKAEPESALEAMQNRVGAVNHDMIVAAALTASFNPVNGKHVQKYSYSKTTITTWHNKNQLHRTNGPAYVMTSENGGSKEQWYKNGKLHREDGPAVTKIDTYGNKTEEWFIDGERYRKDGPNRVTISNGRTTQEYLKDGVPHRDDGPAIIITYDNGSSEERWLKNGTYHRVGGPAVCIVNVDGTYTKKWMRDGHYHNEDGPALLEKDSHGRTTERWYQHNRLSRYDGPAATVMQNGVLLSETWSKDDVTHRDDGPALTLCDPNGTVTQKWLQNGTLARKDGPAIVETRPDGTVREYWYEDGAMVRSEVRTASQAVATPKPAKHAMQTSLS